MENLCLYIKSKWLHCAQCKYSQMTALHCRARGCHGRKKVSFNPKGTRSCSQHVENQKIPLHRRNHEAKACQEPQCLTGSTNMDLVLWINFGETQRCRAWCMHVKSITAGFSLLSQIPIALVRGLWSRKQEQQCLCCSIASH